MNILTPRGPIAATLRVLAALLDYPREDLGGFSHEVGKLLVSEDALTPALRRALAGLASELERADPYERAERWIATFERGRDTALHLFEHVHGESRDRGQAMVDLLSMYDRAGLVLAEGELPDYLPAFLEYLSILPTKAAIADLRDIAVLVRSLGNALARIGSGHARVAAALLELAGEPGLDEAVADAPALPPIDTDALDRAWAEEPVTFGGCDSAPRPADVPAISAVSVQRRSPAHGDAR